MSQTDKKRTSQYTCGDYREEMILLSLRQKLKNATLTQEEKIELEKEITRLEKEIGF